MKRDKREMQKPDRIVQAEQDEDQKRNSGRPRRWTINKRLSLISMVIIIPCMVLIVFLISYMTSFSNNYSRVTESVAYANQYSQNFKERLDYSMYYAVIGGLTMDQLNKEITVNGIETENPYVLIDDLEQGCDEMARLATVPKNKYSIKRVKKSAENLRKSVRSLEMRIQESGTYDDNMVLLDEDIYTMTSVIQGGIQEYIYLETDNFATVREEMLTRNHMVIEGCIFLSLVVILAAICLSTRMSRSISRPIHKLCELTKDVAGGDFTVRSEVKEHADEEIQILSHSFNAMTGEIGELVDHITEEQKALHLTETKLLQAQINPHFLYNTLDTIIWLAEEKQTREVISMVTDLSSFFRTTLSEGRDLISLREEEEHIDSYLKIQQFRYQDIMQYQIDIAEELYAYYIPKLTLQPLVENALYHGVKNKRGMGHIRVTGVLEAGVIILKVRDDGNGMSQEALSLLRQSVQPGSRETERVGFGLQNVNTRIKYYYGEKYGLFFDSVEGEGMTATVIIEAKKKNEF